MKRVTARPLLGLAVPVAALLFAACGGETSAGAGSVGRAAPVVEGGAAVDEAPVTADVAPSVSFATGPAATVPTGYEPPTTHVESTGAYLPANGKPTLVFVDAVW